MREGVRGRGRGTVLDSKRFLPRPLSIFILSPRGCIARTDRLSTNLCDLGPRRDLPTRICGPRFLCHIISLRWGGLLLMNASKDKRVVFQKEEGERLGGNREIKNRSYGVILPSYFNMVLSSALVYSTCSPVSVWGTVSSLEGSPSQFEVVSWKLKP